MPRTARHPPDSAPMTVAAGRAGRPARSVQVLIIGAGQAGLGVAYWLRRITDLDLRIIDRTAVGDSWLERWDSLRLFTPRRFSSLPGMRFPAGAGFPSRLEVAEYLRCYTEQFRIPVETGHEVRRLRLSGGTFCAETDRDDIYARQVVLAGGPFARPYRPAAGLSLDDSVFQLHSSDYRRPSDVPEGAIVVVGGGNSAAQLAVELSQTRTHPVTMISPRPPWFLPSRLLGVDLYWWLYLTGTLNARTSSSLSRYVRERGDAIIGADLRRQVQAGRIRLLTQRVIGATGRNLVLADGSFVCAPNVLWCTGYRPDLEWLDLPGALDASGEPVHRRGASPVPGLHWMGVPWQTRLNSSIIDGIDRDAHTTAKRIRALSTGRS